MATETYKTHIDTTMVITKGTADKMIDSVVDEEVQSEESGESAT